MRDSSSDPGDYEGSGRSRGEGGRCSMTSRDYFTKSPDCFTDVPRLLQTSQNCFRYPGFASDVLRLSQMSKRIQLDRSCHSCSRLPHIATYFTGLPPKMASDISNLFQTSRDCFRRLQIASQTSQDCFRRPRTASDFLCLLQMSWGCFRWPKKIW